MVAVVLYSFGWGRECCLTTTGKMIFRNRPKTPMKTNLQEARDLVAEISNRLEKLGQSQDVTPNTAREAIALAILARKVGAEIAP